LRHWKNNEEKCVIKTIRNRSKIREAKYQEKMKNDQYFESDEELYRVMKKAWRLHSQILPFSHSITFNNYEIYSWIIFANTLGGDHRSFMEFKKRYDLECLAKKSTEPEKIEAYKDRLGIFIADVSGHSFEDILLVHNLHSSLFTALPYELEMNGYVSSKVFCNLNNRIFNSTSPGKYISAIYAELLADKRMRFLIAGHPHPLIYDREKKAFNKVNFRTSVPLGLFPSRGAIDLDPDKDKPEKRASFHFNDICLPDHCIGVLYTDGIIEIEDSSGEPFGIDRLKNVVAENSNANAREIFRQILIATNKHKGNAPTLDDRTMVIIKC
jgi:serine phosphatase RsbU (regulator of sigma subunit)